jgi:hypothetical protein
MKAELKTRETSASVEDFLNSLDDEQKRSDSFAVMEMMAAVLGERAKMWGPNIVGFGSVHLKYESGRELDWMRIGFSPRKANLTIYLSARAARNAELFEGLGKHKLSGSCLHIKRLSDIDPAVLKQVISASLNEPEPK